MLAFDRGYSTVISSMLARGADIVSFGTPLAGCFQRFQAGFQWKVDLVRAMGYSDWITEPPVNPSRQLPSVTLLHGACQELNLQELLFGLEIAGLGPNIGAPRQTALENAAQQGFLKGAAVLIECGADVDSCKDSAYGTALGQSLGGNIGPYSRSPTTSICTDVTQYLLLHGAHPLLKTEAQVSPWHELMWNTAYGVHGLRPTRWSFIGLEGGLAHLLLHGADPFELFLDPSLHAHVYHYPYKSDLQLRAPEIARSWSYCLGEESNWHQEEPELFSERWSSGFQEAEETASSLGCFNWSSSGVIYDGAFEDALDDDYQESPFFRDQTHFYIHIASADGRKKLSRFPMVLALCDALQAAGYRAEMDDDGDIWYEDEDGERYFDALEHQSDNYTRNMLMEHCFICRNFEGHGLGHILVEASEAKHELLEYREKVQRKKRSFF